MENNMEELYLEINNRYDSNIIVYQCGWEKCEPKHSYGPAVRDHYLIHFVKSGKGRLYIDNKEFEINKNEGFLICPNDITYYEADEKEPWDYVWVGFNGIKAPNYIKQMGLGRYNPIIKSHKGEFIIQCMSEIFEATKIKRSREVKMLGYLYLLLSTLLEESEDVSSPDYKDEYVAKAVEYIEMNYSREISIQKLADHLCLNRSYFSNLFKQTLNISPQNFLIQYRISRSCELMKQYNNLSIGDISRSVGYTDPLIFSKTFKKIKGFSPSEYLAKIHTD